MGRLVISRLLEVGHQVTCFSRDEQKQRTMHKNVNLHCIIGDIRDYDSVLDVMENNYHAVLNLAALKCVDTVEANPLESVKTNVLGVQNVIRACEKTSLPKIYFTSTDKACYPINVYGQCKAISERLVNQYRGDSEVFRYGNILGSRGSVLSSFVQTILTKGEVNLTDPEMTRFWVLSHDVADKISESIENNRSENNLSVRLSKTMRVMDVAGVVGDILGHEKINYKLIGIRPGEKIHETLITSHDKVDGDWFDKDVDSFTYDRYSKSEFREMITPLVLRIRESLNL